MKLIIIGAGPGGYETALLAAKRGLEVVLIESGPVGGTCLNEGCIPTKSFWKNAQILEEFQKADEFGIYELSYCFDFSAVTTRKNAIVDQLRSGVESLLTHKMITLVHGKASFKDANTVKVGQEEYTADRIIIATGSTSAALPIPGGDLPDVLTSKELLDTQEIPDRLCVIGGGVIGLEFASIFNGFGSKVTVIEYCKDILPRFDTDLSKRLKQSLGKKGIDILTQAQVQSVVKEEDGLSITYTRKGKDESVKADKVLMAVGRKANVASLNLDEICIEYTSKGIAVNDFMQTSLPHIYAIGDVNGKMMLAHAAIFQGIIALDHIMGIDNTIDLNIMPAAVFTLPEAASVGMTEDECKEKGISIKCLKSFFRANGKAVTMSETDGFCKLIVEDSSEGVEGRDGNNRILGCHLFGPHASDIIQEITALMNKKATLMDLREIIHTHPTLTEVIQAAAHL